MILASAALARIGGQTDFETLFSRLKAILSFPALSFFYRESERGFLLKLCRARSCKPKHCAPGPTHPRCLGCPPPLPPVALPNFITIVQTSSPRVVNISIAGTIKVDVRDLSQLDPNDPFFQLFRRFQPPAQSKAPLLKYIPENSAERRYADGMKAILIFPLNEAQPNELKTLDRKTKDPRLRTRAEMILLSAEQGLKAAGIARDSEDTVVRWLKRRRGRKDAPRPGRQVKVTAAYRAALMAAVRRRPRSLDLPFSLRTLQRLVDYLAEQTGIRIALKILRQVLKGERIVLSRPPHKISSPDPE